FAFVIRVNNLRFADVDLGSPQPTVFASGDVDISGRAERFIPRPLCLVANALGLIAHSLCEVTTALRFLTDALGFGLRRHYGVLDHSLLSISELFFHMILLVLLFVHYVIVNLSYIAVYIVH